MTDPDNVRSAPGGTDPSGASSESPHTPDPALPDPAVPDPAVPDPVLPAPVRQRVIAVAAAVLGELPADELPGAVRRIARFAPQRRAKLGGAAIAAQLSTDAPFRHRVAERVVRRAGDLGAAVRDGAHPAAADPVEVAALAYLVRPEGWTELVAAASDAVQAEVADQAVAGELRTARVEADRSRAEADAARTESERLREQAASLAAEAGQLREQVRQLTRALRDAEEQQRRTAQLLATEKGRLNRAGSEHDAELRRLRTKLAETERELAGSRQSGREGRAIDDARVWLLLETIGQAAHGLRRELALEPTEKLPADFVAMGAADTAAEAAERPRGLEADDPARLDQLLALPKAHLVIDGYNVTKQGYGELVLEQQRKRLVSGLGGLAAQTGAEVTVVFDGAERVVGLPPAPRGVRVLFSRKGETADELIRRLVRAEPAGRPVVVVSSDREVADGVRRHGAYPLGSDTLLRRLERG
ncbi:MAG: NYN domain-containing protein [Micromonosporaceae bacterium]